MAGSLSGRSVVVTRADGQNHELSSMLVELGADVIEMPLIAIEEPEDSGRERDEVLQHLELYDWLVVTSPNGAERVAPFVRAAIAADRHQPLPRIAAVGEATARTLGHHVDLVAMPARATALVEQFPTGTGTVLVVQGDLADETLARGLASKGWTPTRVLAYRTVGLQPEASIAASAVAADVLFLASGSAARAWHDSFGTRTPAVVISIGPSTTAVAERLGLEISATADEQSIASMVAAADRALAGQ